MTNKDTKVTEIGRIKAFFKCLGCKIKTIKSWKPDPPDAIATIKLSNRNQWQSIGIEETRHYSGTKHGQRSQEQFLSDFWELTRTSISRRIAKRKDVENIHGYVTLNKEALLCDAIKIRKKKQVDCFARNIAKELIGLALEFFSIVTPNGISLVCRRLRHSGQLQVPSRYAFLNQYVLEIKLRRSNCWMINRYKWLANIKAAHIGISAEDLIEIIIQKANGLQKWSCGNIAERWLLITAPATTVHNSMHSHPEHVKWNDLNLINQCCSSGFNRIFFWSRKPPGWYKQIWPQSRSVQVLVK
jgi:hypothetical protein